MSIKGIDSQIMVTRTAEFAKDSVAQLKKNELTQDYLAVQAAATEAAEKKKVSKTQETEKTGLHLNTDGDSASSGESGQGGGSGTEGETDDESVHYVPSEDHIIDIKV